MSKIRENLENEIELLNISAGRGFERIELIDVDRLRLNPSRVRRQINREDIALMAKNVKIFGIMQPLVVDEQNRVILGTRRLEAAKLAGLEKVPVIKRDAASYSSIEKELISDLHSKHLSVIERAFAFQQLMELKGVTKYFIANYLGLSHNLVCRTIAILKANKNTLQLMKEGKIGQRVVAMVLYRLKDKNLEDYVMQEIMNKKMNIIQAGNFVAELNDPEIFKKHFLRQVRAFKTMVENYNKKLDRINLTDEQKREIAEEFENINNSIKQLNI